MQCRARFGEFGVLGFVWWGFKIDGDSGGANVPEWPLVSTSRDWLSGTQRFPE